MRIRNQKYEESNSVTRIVGLNRKSSATKVGAALHGVDLPSVKHEDTTLKLVGSLVRRIASSLHIILGLAQFLGDVSPRLNCLAVEWACEVLRTT